MIETYLSTRKTLKGVALIMDIRRIPGIQDLNFIEWLYYYNIPGMLILTKADKLSKTKQLTQKATIAKALSVDKDDLILFSAKSRLGKDVVWDAIEELIGF
jgi:GTP-binding protein